MKLKKILLSFVFVLGAFLIFNLNAKAYEIEVNGKIHTEETIYNDFSTYFEDFDIKTYSKIGCGKLVTNLYCYAFLPETQLKFYNTSAQFVSDGYEYYIISYKTNETTYEKRITSSGGGFSITKYYGAYTNFYILDYTEDENKTINVLDFSPYMKLEEPELEITIEGTNVLNFMLDKTKNIYEVLIANQFFALCLSILLSYLVFIILYKIIKR